MLRPLDMQVSWKAIPTHAYRVLQEQASAMYRSMQNMNASHTRNLRQTEMVTKSKNIEKANFYPIQNSNANDSFRSAEVKERYKAKSGREKHYANYNFRNAKQYKAFDAFGTLLDLRT